MQLISRKGHFDAMHRIMDQRFKCYSIHGHSYLYELTFKFEQVKGIGYSIDFGEIKRLGIQWIEENLDHAAILNPEDTTVLEACQKLESRYYLMNLNGLSYCNPSAENISKEIFLAMESIFLPNYPGLKPYQVRLWETPNCWVDCFESSISNTERSSFKVNLQGPIERFLKKKGYIEYDSRELGS